MGPAWAPKNPLCLMTPFIPYMPAPIDLIEEYATEGGQAAFYAGWLAGTGNLPSDLSAQLGNVPD